ncbi:unnamed protein product [Haemonchus placei]|uniref:Uncharacterized protein n=1 Tax=Haemonchus placei TaxID=6290 RepID=A0A0N4X1M6_HAEPC|nr:unnamed protein product [Haemonchus placei]
MRLMLSHQLKESCLVLLRLSVSFTHTVHLFYRDELELGVFYRGRM